MGSLVPGWQRAGSLCWGMAELPDPVPLSLLGDTLGMVREGFGLDWLLV